MRNLETRDWGFPPSIVLYSVCVGNWKRLLRWMTWPTVSNPRLPERPAIWVYSCEYNNRWVVPSNLVRPMKTDVRIGQSNPMAKLSVANKNLIYFLEIINSTISRKIGIIPEWWIPIPFSKRLTKLLYSGSSKYSW